MRIVEIEPTLNVGCTQCGAPGVQALVLSENGFVVEVVEIQCATHADALRETV